MKYFGALITILLASAAPVQAANYTFDEAVALGYLWWEGSPSSGYTETKLRVSNESRFTITVDFSTASFRQDNDCQRIGLSYEISTGHYALVLPVGFDQVLYFSSRCLDKSRCVPANGVPFVESHDIVWFSQLVTALRNKKSQSEIWAITEGSIAWRNADPRSPVGTPPPPPPPGTGDGTDPGTSFGDARKFTSIPSDITVPLGGMIDLTVRWDGLAYAQWYKEYSLLTYEWDDPSRMTTTYLPTRNSANEARLTIVRAKASDAGDYWVTVVNPGITTTRRIRVTVGGGTSAFQVSITSPANGATLQAPAAVKIQVGISPPQQINLLEIVKNGTDISQTYGPTPPYEFSFSNVGPGSYTYVVTAKSASGATATSAPITITVVAASGVPPAPVSKAATSVGLNGFTANWNAVSGILGYIIDVSTTSTFSSFVSGYNGVGVGSGLSANITGLNAGTTYYYRVRAYNSKGVSGNSATITVITARDTTPSKPDLILTGIDLLPAVVEEGKTTLVTATIKNNGGSAAGATRVRLQFSPKNDGIETDDAKFEAPLNIAALAAGNTYTVQWNAIMPNLGTGTYDFWPAVAVDVDNAVAESNESNLFISGVAFTGKDAPLPDLQVTGTTVIGSAADGVAEEGKTIQIQAVIFNAGEGNAGATRARFWFSPKNDWDTSDDFKVEPPVAVPALAAGKSYTAQWSVVMPNLGTGTYDYWAVVEVDVDGAVVESDEGNPWKTEKANKAKDAVPIKPDLMLSAISLSPTVIEEGKNVRVTAEVKNIGTGSAGASRCRLSFTPKDDFIYTDDFKFDLIANVSALTAGQAKTVTWDVVMPNLGTGTYDFWPIVEIDIDNAVAEIDEANPYKGTISYKGKDVPQPDLKVGTVTVGGIAEEGKTIVVQAVIENGGLTNAAATRARLWLSPKDDFETGDDHKVEAVVSVPVLAPGKSFSAQWNLTMPNLGSGTYDYWVLTEVDIDGAVVESDERNLWKWNDSFKARDASDGGSVLPKGDLNRDGRTDIVFQDAGGSLAAWFMDGGTLLSSTTLTPNKVSDANYRIAASGDFNNDGKEDLVLQHTDGTLAVWYMDGVKLTSGVLLNPTNPGDRNWRVVAAGDFNKDGKVDLVFQHTDGTLAAWFMDGIKRTSAVLLNPSRPGDAQWRVTGVADFNADGNLDLAFQHADGTLAVWHFNGTTRIQTGMMNPQNPGDNQWHVVSIADRNKDGKPDLLFQHVDGSLAVWFMDGLKLSSARLLNPSKPGGTWKVVAP